MPTDAAHRLTDVREILIRQIHPSFVDEMGRPSTVGFKPGRKDEFQLSVDRESKTSAEEATMAWLNAERATIGAWGVTVMEGKERDVVSFDDELEEQKAHALMDMSHLSNKKRNRAASHLAAAARGRGCLFRV